MPKKEAGKTRWRTRRDKRSDHKSAAEDSPERRAEREAQRRRSGNAGRPGNPLEKGIIGGGMP